MFGVLERVEAGHAVLREPAEPGDKPRVVELTCAINHLRVVAQQAVDGAARCNGVDARSEIGVLGVGEQGGELFDGTRFFGLRPGGDEGRGPVGQDAVLGQWVGDRLDAVTERERGGLLFKVIVEGGVQGVGVGADHKPVLGRAQLVEQVGRRVVGEVGVEEIVLRGKPAQRSCQFGDVVGLFVLGGEDRGDGPEAGEACRPPGAGLVIGAGTPPQLGEHARGPGKAEQPKRISELGERGEVDRRVVVVNPLDVAFGVARRHVALHGGQRVVLGVDRGVGQHAVGQVLSAVDRVGLADQGLIPHFAGGVQAFVVQGLEELGAGEVQRLGVVAHHGGQVHRLHVDREPVAAEADGVFAAVLQVDAVLELADGVFLGRLQLRLDVAHADGVVEFFQLRDDVADLIDHQVAGEVGVDVRHVLHRLGPAADALEDPLGGLAELVGPLVALLDQGELAVFEGRVDLFALLGEFEHKIIELGEAAFQLFELHHELGEVGVGLLGRIRQIQVVGHRLV